MDRFLQMSIFVAVAEAGSFAAAARRLQMSPPAVTRAITALEARLGVPLLSRTTRVVRLTDPGAHYLDDARRILADTDEADAAAAGNNATPRGRLAVTAPALFGKLYVMPLLTEYQVRHRETTVSALFVDRLVSLAEEGLDVAIRIGSLPDSSLRAIRVGRVRPVVVGAPAYLAEHGIPQSPAELAGHRLVATSAVTPVPEWRFAEAGESGCVRIAPQIVVNTNDGALEAARLGFGLTRLLSYQVAPQLAAGELQAVLGGFEGPELPIHVLHREGRHGSAKVRTFIDLAVERLRADPALR